MRSLAEGMGSHGEKWFLILYVQQDIQDLNVEFGARAIFVIGMTQKTTNMVQISILSEYFSTKTLYSIDFLLLFIAVFHSSDE